jgi:hypothetical protein
MIFVGQSLSKFHVCQVFYKFTSHVSGDSPDFIGAIRGDYPSSAALTQSHRRREERSLPEGDEGARSRGRFSLGVQYQCWILSSPKKMFQNPQNMIQPIQPSKLVISQFSCWIVLDVLGLFIKEIGISLDLTFKHGDLKGMFRYEWNQKLSTILVCRCSFQKKIGNMWEPPLLCPHCSNLFLGESHENLSYLRDDCTDTWDLSCSRRGSFAFGKVLTGFKWIQRVKNMAWCLKAPWKKDEIDLRCGGVQSMGNPNHPVVMDDHVPLRWLPLVVPWRLPGNLVYLLVNWIISWNGPIGWSKIRIFPALGAER